MLFPSLLARGLSRVLKTARGSGPIVLDPTHRYVIFSDHHKGGKTGADDFQFSKAAYLAALDYYYAQGYQLIILGDAEELWEESIEAVIASHRDVFDSEARFHLQGRYMRIFGNHDSNWASEGQVKKHLHQFFPNLQVHEGMIFRYNDPEPDNSGDVFLVHGHQGTLDSELFAPISRVIVRAVWRTFQILFGYAGTTPAKDECLRGKHDTLMYEWASKQGKLLLIAGHTHRPIWGSRTMLETKLIQLEALELANEIMPVPGYHEQRMALREQIQALTRSDKLCRDTIKTSPSYYNDGCCSFSDGQVTAYELVDNELRLARWQKGSTAPETLGSGKLAAIFFSL